MKKLLPLLLISTVCLLSGCETKKEKRKSTYDGTNGTSISYYGDSDALKTEIEYKNQKMDGWYKEYYKNGQLKSEIWHREGKMNGIFKEYYEDGKTKSIAYYKNDKLDSLNQIFYTDGKIKSERHYLNGRLHGKLVNYYPDGKVTLETNYLYGMQNGEEKTYYPNGKLHSVKQFSRDREEPNSQEFSEDGKAVLVERPVILIEEINTLSLNGKYTYRFRLNKPSPKDIFKLFLEEVGDNGKLNHLYVPISKQDGYYEYTFFIPKNSSVTEVFKVEAISGSTNKTAERKLNVALNNFY